MAGIIKPGPRKQPDLHQILESPLARFATPPPAAVATPQPFGPSTPQPFGPSHPQPSSPPGASGHGTSLGSLVHAVTHGGGTVLHTVERAVTPPATETALGASPGGSGGGSSLLGSFLHHAEHVGARAASVGKTAIKIQLAPARFAIHEAPRAASNLEEDAINWPGGIATLGQAEWGALKQTYEHPWVSRDQGLQMWAHPLTPIAGTANTPAITGAGKGLLAGLEQPVEHPLRRPGDTLLNLFAALSLGAGTAARIGAAGAALREGEGVGSALARTGSQGGSILHRPEPGVQRIYAPSPRPEPVAGPLEDAQARVTDLTSQLEANTNTHGAHSYPVPSGEKDGVHDVASLERFQAKMQDAGLTPPKELNHRIRLARERARISKQLDDAEKLVGQHEEKQAGVTRGAVEGPRSAIHVDRLMSHNAFAREFQKQRNIDIQRTLMEENPRSARSAVGKAVQSVFSAQATFGRERRAMERVRASERQAPITQLSHAVEGIVGHGIDDGEHAAVSVVGMEGHHAFGGEDAYGHETPAQVIERHIKAHEQNIAEGYDEEGNRRRIEDLQAALPHLENPSAKFLRALEFSRRVSQQTGRLLKQHGMLSGETEESRIANMAALYRGNRYEAPTPGKLGKSAPLDDARARVARIEKAYDRLDAKGKRGGYIDTTVDRPRTVEEAQARYDAIDKKIEDTRQVLRDAMLAKDDDVRLTKGEEADNRGRNTDRGKAERQGKGLTRQGLLHERTVEKLAVERSRLDELQTSSPVPTPKLEDQIAKTRKKIAELETKLLEFNGKRLKSGARGAKATARPTVKEELREEGERVIDAALEKNRAVPEIAAYHRLVEERDMLREALHPHPGFMADEAPPADLGRHTATETEYRRSAPSLERQGGALSVAKDDLEAQQRRVDARMIPTGMSGETKAPEGSFYFPMSRRYTDEPASLAPNTARVSPGQYGIAPPSASRSVPGVGQQFTGRSAREGRFPARVARSIAQRATHVNQLIATKLGYDEMWRVASPVRQNEHQIPIRYGPEVQSKLKDFFARLAEDTHRTHDEEMKVSVEEAKSLGALLQPAEHEHAPVGERIAGVRWVDRRYLKSNGEVSVRSGVEKVADAINNPVRAVQLYARPAYVLNLAGNIGMDAVTGGLRVGPSMKRAVHAVAEDGEDNAALVDSLMGTSRSRIQAVPTGPGADVNRRLSEGWNLITDMYSRRSAFYTEAHRAGYDTPEEINRLLHDPKLESKRIEVVRRSNKNIVDYDSLTPVEKNTLRRIVYFYPWVSRGTIWALRSVVEHPAKAFTAAELAHIGAENMHKALGAIPRWADQLGLVPVGGHHGPGGDLQGTLNLSSINTGSTLAQVMEAVTHPLDKDVGLSNLLTPATGAGVSLLGSGAGESPPKGVFGHLGGWARPLGSTLESLPPVQAIRRSGVAPWLAGEPSKTYPGKGIGPAVGPFSAGGAYDRDVSLSALHGQAEKQKPRDVRAADHVRNEQQTLLSEARRVKLMGAGQELPASLVKAYAVQEQRQVSYARLGASPTQQQRFEADLALAVKTGGMTPEESKELLAGAKRYPQNIAKARRWINDTYFGGKLLTAARTAVRKHGGDLTP